MRSVLLALLGASVGASGCGPAPPPFRPVADVKTVCAGIIDPSAMTLWNAVGWVDSPDGTEEIYPRTDEEWLAVRNASVTLAEAGNLMMMPPRARDSGDWTRLSRALVDMGEEAVHAAEAQDKDQIFTIGGDLYEICTNCHSKYNSAVIGGTDAEPGAAP